MRFRTCRRCGCPYNRAGNLICADCGCMLTFARRPRPAHPVVATPVRAVALAPSPYLRVPFGPRAGEPVSVTRLALAEATSTLGAQYLLAAIVLFSALLVILAARGL